MSDEAIPFAPPKGAPRKPDWAEREADSAFEGPVDKYGAPAIGNDPLDIEVRFQKEGPVLYRFYFDGTRDRHPYTGRWRESRSEAYAEGLRWVNEGRL